MHLKYLEYKSNIIDSSLYESTEKKKRFVKKAT